MMLRTTRRDALNLGLLVAAASLAVLAPRSGLGREPGPDRPTSSAASEKGHVMHRIKIQIDGQAGEIVEAMLEDGQTAVAFRAMLPLTLTLTDYNATEKISDLPKRLPTGGAPVGVEPEAGDLTYYAPWGNLAIFYKNFGYSRGLVRLGRISRIPQAFRGPDPVVVTIEAAP